MNALTIRKMIDNSSFAGKVDEIMAAARPAIRLYTERVTLDELPLGASRMGGLPDMPPGVPWPEFEGRPLEFLAQINFKEAASVAQIPELPDSGWLIVFYDLHQRSKNAEDIWRGLIFDVEEASLQRQKPQKEVERGLRLWSNTPSGTAPPKDVDFHLCKLRMEAWTCPPDEMVLRAAVLPTLSRSQASWWRRILQPAMKQTVQDEEMLEDWYELEELFEEQIGSPYHLLGGTPAIVQGDPRESGANYLLLQIDSDIQGPDWMWGDMGRMYFTATKAGMAARDFSQVEASWDSH